MKIKSVEAFPQRYQEPNDRLMWRHVTLVKITCDDGTFGWGECISQWPESALAVKTLIERGLAQVLIDRDPLDNHALFLAMKDQSWWYGDTGMAMFALSACDMALWDLKGKILGVPVHQLLGGKLRDKVRTCASTHPSKASLDDLAQELADHAADGYTCVKVGFGKTGEANLGVDPRRDVEYVKTVRAAIGPNVDFVIDIGKKTRWDAALGIRQTRAFEEYGILWIEDPFLPSDVEAHQRLRAAIQTPIGLGERNWTVADYKRMIDNCMGDVFLVDPGRVAGITGYKEVIDLTVASHHYINAHSWSSAINTAAALHLTAIAPNYIIFEMKPLPSPLQYELVAEPFVQKGGWLEVPDKPGLGVDVNEAVVQKYLFT